MIQIIGDGGHAKVVKEVIALQYPWWKRWIYYGNPAFIAVGNNRDRRKETLAWRGGFCKPLIHPKAWVSPSARIGAGTIVMAGAVVQASARIGKHCIINTGASVDHDCIIEDFVHVAPGVHLCGGVHVEEGCLLAVGLGFAPNSKIPRWTFVKAKGIVHEPIPGD